jgi:hypothetical protein
MFLCLQLCQQCFFVAFENEIHKTIVDNRLFKPGERVAIGASGGKGGPFVLLLLAFFASSPFRKCIRVSCFLRLFLTLGFHVLEGILDIRVPCL